MKRNLLIIIIAFIGAIAFNIAKAQTSGSCGPNLIWQLTGSDDELMMTISGNGEMFDNNRPWDFCKDRIKTIIINEGVTSIGESAFQNFKKLTSVVISNSVTTIGKLNFVDCPDLVSVEIGNSVNSIGDWAFFCSGLTSVIIPNSVKSIGNYAFAVCVNLRSVTLGNSLVWIKDNSFGFCVQLDTIICKTKNPFTLGKFAFSYRQNACVFVPPGTLSNYQNSDWGAIFNNFFEYSESRLPPKNEVIAVGEKVNDYWIATHPNPGNNEWTKATYFAGNLEFYKVSQKKSYLDYAIQWANNNNWAVNGGIATSSADNHASGQVYIDLYLMDEVKVPSKISAIKSAIDYWIQYYPESANWWWIDAMFMAMPTITRLGVACNDTKYFDKLYALFHNTRDTLIVYAGTSYWPQEYRNQYGTGPIVTCPSCGNESDGLYNKTDGLWWRDWGYQPNVPPKKDPYNSYQTDVPKQSPNGKNIYWSRGNGWVFAALARTLQCLPVTDAHYREYAGVFTEMAEALKNCQRSDGFWNMNLGDPDHYPAPETSGTGFFTYGLAWGINNGFLDRNTYYPTVAKAWNGLVAIAIQPNGNVGNIQGVGEFPRDPSIFFTTAVDFGVGAVLLAAAEVAKLAGEETGINPPAWNRSVKPMINVYPNPVKAGQPFTIKIDSEFSNATAKIYTFSGVKLLEQKVSSSLTTQIINIKGTYIVEVITNTEKSIFKVMIK